MPPHNLRLLASRSGHERRSVSPVFGTIRRQRQVLSRSQSRCFVDCHRSHSGEQGGSSSGTIDAIQNCGGWHLYWRTITGIALSLAVRPVQAFSQELQQFGVLPSVAASHEDRFPPPCRTAFPPGLSGKYQGPAHVESRAFPARHTSGSPAPRGRQTPHELSRTVRNERERGGRTAFDSCL